MNYLFSVQHTGTWFVINALQKMGVAFTQLSNFDKRPGRVRFNYNFIHSHISYIDPEIDSEKHIDYERMEAILKAEDKIIVPLRDPMLSIITRHNRHPDLSHSHIIGGFKMIVEIYKEMDNVLFFPVDIASKEDKIELLHTAANHFGHIPKESAVEEIAESWEPVNMAADLIDLKEKYLNGEYELLKQIIRPEAEMLSVAFKDDEDFIDLFISKFGYELPWMQW